MALDEGWGVRDGDVMHVVPEIDLPEIVSYAREKKVGIILWVVAKVLDDKGSVAVDKGSRALGKQLGKTRGMFKAFKDEYQKASGGSSKATK